MRKIAVIGLTLALLGTAACGKKPDEQATQETAAPEHQQEMSSAPAEQPMQQDSEESHQQESGNAE